MRRLWLLLAPCVLLVLPACTDAPTEPTRYTLAGTYGVRRQAGELDVDVSADSAWLLRGTLGNVLMCTGGISRGVGIAAVGTGRCVASGAEAVFAGDTTFTTPESLLVSQSASGTVDASHTSVQLACHYVVTDLRRGGCGIQNAGGDIVTTLLRR